MSVKSYLASLPERLVRSVVGMTAGAARETGELVLPDGVRQSQLYRNVVDSTLRFLIEKVGSVEGVYGSADALPDDFLVRRTAGNAIEVLGIVAFRASPVWVLAALADLSGMGRKLIPEIADALKTQGLLEKDVEYTSVDHMLDGMERTSTRLASNVNTPPLRIADLRAEWTALRKEAAGLATTGLPSRETIGRLWDDLRAESHRQNRSIFETSSLMAVSAARTVPDGVRWFSRSARVGTVRTGQVFGAALMDHYRHTLGEIQDVGYLTYANRTVAPYLRAAMSQFSPSHRTLTDAAIEKVETIRSSARSARRRSRTK